MGNEFMKLNLQRFAEGGATGEGAPSGQVQSGENTQVVYGKQPGDNAPQGAASAAGEQGAEGSAQNGAGEETFEELIKGKYKKDFDKTMHNIVGRRLSAERAKTQESDAILQKLMVRHGVKSLSELNKALDDDSQYEAIAARTGENADTLREMERLRGIEFQWSRQQEQTEAQRRADEQLSRWQQEAEGMRELYPEFDLSKELENEQFRALISTKNPQYQISMADAYKLIHHDALIKAAEAEAASKLAKSVNARAARPSENGLGNQSGITVKNDVSKLTKKDRAEIARRVARGEKIEF